MIQAWHSESLWQNQHQELKVLNHRIAVLGKQHRTNKNTTWKKKNMRKLKTKNSMKWIPMMLQTMVIIFNVTNWTKLCVRKLTFFIAWDGFWRKKKMRSNNKVWKMDEDIVFFIKMMFEKITMHSTVFITCFWLFCKTKFTSSGNNDRYKRCERL